MSQRAIFKQTEFHYDLQKCLSPTPTVSGEVVQARTLNGNVYDSLRAALEGELRNVQNQMTRGLTFKGKILTVSELNPNYAGGTGDYFYCSSSGLYYAWNGSQWEVCGDASVVANHSVTPQKTTFIAGDEYPNLIADNATVDGELNNAGSYDANANYKVLLHGIPVTEGRTYCFSINGYNVYIAKLIFKTADDLTEFQPATLVSTHVNLGVSPITAPAGAKYMYVSIANSDGDISKLVAQESATPQPISNETVLRDTVRVPHCVQSNLYGLKMMTLGDSLSAEGVWQEYVQKYTGLSKIVNLARSGTAISHFTDEVTESNIADVDVVFVMGLFNSVFSNPGTVADEPDNADNASICAGYKYIVEMLYALKPSVKIVLASPHRPQANDVAEKAKAVGMVAAYYGIPFIDLYNTAGFNDYTYSLYLRDSVHSSYNEGGGYEQEAKVIAGGLIRYFG